MDSPSDGSQSPHVPGDETNDGRSLPRPRAPNLTIDPARVLRLLLTVTAILIVLSLVGQAMVLYLPDFPLRDGVANTLYIDREQNVPTLYSSMALLVAASLSGLIAFAHARGRGRDVRSWAVLAVVFLLMAVDESAGLHEESAEPLRELLGIERGPLFFAWVIPGAAVVVLLAAMLARFLQHLPKSTRRRFLAAGALYVGGAIGVEMVGGWYASGRGTSELGYVLIATVEEALEMLGIAVLVHALLAYIQVELPDIRLRVGIRAAGSRAE
jgi:hypothetical protein